MRSAAPARHAPDRSVQPTDATRAKQLEQWAQLVVAWHAVQKKTEMTVRDWPHWENAAVGRRLPDDGVRLVMDHLVSRGNGEWMDDAHTRCRVFYRKPEEWAALVLAWAQSRHQVGEILTLFDLHSGDASRGSGACARSGDGACAASLAVRRPGAQAGRPTSSRAWVGCLHSRERASGRFRARSPRPPFLHAPQNCTGSIPRSSCARLRCWSARATCSWTGNPTPPSTRWVSSS